MPARVPEHLLAPFLLDVPHPRTAPILRDEKRISPLEIDPVCRPFVWTDLFGCAGPVEIEVGFGKGLFLQNASAARPSHRFIGVEIERKYVLHTASLLAKRGAENVRLACTDGKWFLQRRIADSSVHSVHVFFPDPWWKNRHHKRKLFTPDFVEQVARTLEPGGLFHFVTDVSAYFDDSLQIMTKYPMLQAEGVPEIREAEHEMDYLTNFERKYRREGRTIYRAMFRKK